MSRRQWKLEAKIGNVNVGAGELGLDERGLVIDTHTGIEVRLPLEATRELGRAIRQRWESSEASGHYDIEYCVEQLPIWRGRVPYGHPVPDAAEQVDVGETRYIVSSRVWVIDRLEVRLCVHLRRMFDRQERSHQGACGADHGEPCTCR